MPWIVAGLIVGWAAGGAVGRRRLLAGWVACFAASALAGLYDFWRWGYDYGHDLDPSTRSSRSPG